jgi:hypothetical protein
MKSKRQKQTEANERRVGSIKMYERSIIEYERLKNEEVKQDHIKRLWSKIGRLEQDIQNTEARMR